MIIRCEHRKNYDNHNRVDIAEEKLHTVVWASQPDSRYFFRLHCIE